MTHFLNLHALFLPHKQYDNLWTTITNISQASLGEFLKFCKSIIDKARFCVICFSMFINIIYHD